MRLYVLSLLVLTVASATPSGAQSNSVLMLLPTEGRQLELGGEHSGALSTSDYVSAEDYLLEAWELEGRAGESVTIDLLSEAFDAYLYVVGPGLGEPLSNDDGGDDRNSRLSVTLPESGTYRIIASSFSNGATGAYTLTVR